MARDVNTDNVLSIIRALTEANASGARGLSIPEISEVTDLSRYVIKTIIERNEYGFVTASGRSNTGATTYFHDATRMTAQMTANGKIQPLQFDDEEKLTLVVHNLMTALATLDPVNQYTQGAAAELLRGPKAPSSKNYFEWFLDPTDLKFLQRKGKNEKDWQGKTIRTKIDKQTPNDTPKEYVTMIKRLAESLTRPDNINWEDEAMREVAIRNVLGLLYLTLKTNRVIGAIQQAEALRDLSNTNDKDENNV